MKRPVYALILVVILLIIADKASSQQLSFPTAEGFGRFASGGRGGAVCKVTNLNDSGAGSLRACLGQAGARTVLFSVSGIITLTSAITVIADNVTIACHSAPGQGVLIKGSLKFWDTQNVIMRFCRLRPPPPTDATFAVGISVTGPYNALSYLIFDHISLGWVYDDAFGVTLFDTPASQPMHATIQWSIISESVASPAGVGAGSQGAAGGGVFNPNGVMNVSWLYNLYSNVGKRTPHPGSGSRHQIVNQVIHNARSSSFENIYILARFQPTIANIVGNWYRNRGGNNWGYSILGCGWPNYTCNPSAELASNIYYHGNIDTIRRPDATVGSELSMVLQQNAQNFTVQSTTPNSGFPTLPSQTTAASAYPMVLANVGAHKPFRDAIDQRAITDTQTDVRRSTCPVTPSATCFTYPTYASGTVPTDTDDDGIPNTWETAHGLNPNSPADGAQITASGYSNLELYLHELAGEGVTPPPSPPPPRALRLTHTCGTPSNTLTARVMGTVLYLAPGATTTADALVRSECASGVTITDTASVAPSPFSLVAPWQWLGTAGPNTGNTCTSCLAVHAGTPSVNEAGAGYTLTTFQQGTSVSAATGGLSAFAALPGLCRQVVDGVVTSAPLWPWSMEARIQAARSLADKPPVNVTLAVEAALGPIPTACRVPPPGEPQTVWVMAPGMATPAGIDGVARACTLEEPCATFAHVGPRMGSGHRLLVRGGTYAQRLTPGLFPPGTSWAAPTTIAAYQNETVTLQLTTGDLMAFNQPATDRYLLLAGLDVDGQASASTTTRGLVVSNGAGPIRYQDGAIRNTARERVFVDGAQGLELLSTTVTGGKLAPAYPAISVQGVTHGLLLKESTIEDSPSHGVQFLGQDHTQARVTQSIVRSNGGSGIALNGSDVQIDNTLVVGNTEHGIHLTENSVGNVLSNNTVADNTGVGVQIDEEARDTQVTNTLLFGNATPLTDAGTDTVATTNLTTDPGFVGGGNYQIASGASPAVDSGTSLAVGSVALDGTLRPLGAGWDIGAYEMAGSPLEPPAVTRRAVPLGAGMFLEGR